MVFKFGGKLQCDDRRVDQILSTASRDECHTSLRVGARDQNRSEERNESSHQSQSLEARQALFDPKSESYNQMHKHVVVSERVAVTTHG